MSKQRCENKQLQKVEKQTSRPIKYFCALNKYHKKMNTMNSKFRQLFQYLFTLFFI